MHYLNRLLSSTLACMMLALPVRGDALSDLRGLLQGMTSHEPVKATLNHEKWSQTIEDKKPKISQAQISALIEDGPQGLRMQWGRPLFSEAQKEARVKLQNPEANGGTRNTLEDLGPVETYELLNAADPLLRELEQCQLLSVRDENWNGIPARLLELKTEPKMSQDQKKALKELKVHSKVWVGMDGMPVGALQEVTFKGSKFFISFEGSNKEEFRFQKIGNRLVAIQCSKENYNKAMGTTHQSKRITRLTVN